MLIREGEVYLMLGRMGLEKTLHAGHRSGGLSDLENLFFVRVIALRTMLVS